MLKEVKEKLNSLSLPSKPKSFGSEYEFPEDIEKVSSPELGTLMFKLAAWKGYLLRILAVSEIERSWFKTKIEGNIAKKIAKESSENKKITKDHALGQLLLDDEIFRKTKEQFLYKDSEIESLKNILEIYTMQIEVVSREISRRTLDLKMIQSGISQE